VLARRTASFCAAASEFDVAIRPCALQRGTEVLDLGRQERVQLVRTFPGFARLVAGDHGCQPRVGERS
jgi:hypothetical protein